MDQIMNFTGEDVIVGGKRKGVDHHKSDGISFSNYNEDDLTVSSNVDSGLKAAAGCKSSQISNNVVEPTLKSCRQRQMASDIFGLGMDKVWAPIEEPVVVESVPETPSEVEPLNLTQSQEIVESEVSSPVAEDAPQSIEVAEVAAEESVAIEEAPAATEPSAVAEQGGVDGKAVKTGKRHFEGKNEITKFW